MQNTPADVRAAIDAATDGDAAVPAAETDAAAQAYDALVASGRLVERVEDHRLWLVAGERQILDDAALIALASGSDPSDGSA